MATLVSLERFLRDASAAVGELAVLLPPEASRWRPQQPLVAVRPEPNQPARLQALGSFFAATAWAGDVAPQSSAPPGASSQPPLAAPGSRTDTAPVGTAPASALPAAPERQAGLLAPRPLAAEALETLLPAAGLSREPAPPQGGDSSLVEPIGEFFATVTWPQKTSQGPDMAKVQSEKTTREATPADAATPARSEGRVQSAPPTYPPAEPELLVTQQMPDLDPRDPLDGELLLPMAKELPMFVRPRAEPGPGKGLDAEPGGMVSAMPAAGQAADRSEAESASADGAIAESPDFARNADWLEQSVEAFFSGVAWHGPQARVQAEEQALALAGGMPRPRFPLGPLELAQANAQGGPARPEYRDEFNW